MRSTWFAALLFTLHRPSLVAQAPIVPAGSSAVDGTRIMPGTTTRRLSLERGGQRQDVGSIVDAISEGAGGRLVRVQTITMPRGVLVDSAIVERRTLVPHHHASTSADRTMRVDFAGTRMTGAYVPKDSAARTIDQHTDLPVFDSNIYDLVVEALPLADGYAARLPVYVYERGGQVWMDVSVLGSDADAGTDTWRVQVILDGQASTMWISKDTRQLRRLTAERGPGVTFSMIAEH